MVSERGPGVDSRADRENRAVQRAITAWAERCGAVLPEQVQILKAPRHKGKSVVVDLGPVGPGGIGVVAKELRRQAAQIELAVYTAVLPRLTVRGPELVGCANSTAHEMVWLFLESISSSPFDKADRSHVRTASNWLADFHAETATVDLADLVPGRDAGHYSSLLTETIPNVDEVSENRALDSTQRALLHRISASLRRLLQSSSAFESLYASLPTALVHGDFKGNNMAFSLVGGKLELNVFDWSESHRGPMAVDLWWIDSDVYATGLRRLGLPFDAGTIEEWQRFAAIVRWVSAIAWEVPRLRYEWVERPMRRMALYEGRLRAAIEDAAWVS